MSSHVLKYIALAIIAAVLLVWGSIHDTISCQVDNAEVANINGYYSAYNGVYVKRSNGDKYIFPDLFDIYTMRRLPSKDGVVIARDKSGWGIYTVSPQRRVYGNSGVKLDNNEKGLFPPSFGWERSGEALSPMSDSIVVQGCRGSLSDSVPISAQRSNIQIMLNRPVTTVLCAVLLIIAYLLWSGRTEVSAVSFSYESVVLGKEYWRALSASFSHFDIMHIAFNVMSLYQLGEMEIEYGSPAFAYLSADLVVITMALCCGMVHVLIHRCGRHELESQQAVGYSCVLFAWMVAAAVRMDKYCPLFFMPSLCFNTATIPIPLLSTEGLPVNLGPLVLLLITKLILPRSSLTGHLAGIIIGFPLAWNMLAWLKPPILLVSLCLLVIADKRLWVWRFPGFELRHTVQDLQEFVPHSAVMTYRSMKIVALLCALVLVATVLLYTSSIVTISEFGMHFVELVPRCCLVLLAFAGAEAVRCEWLSDLRTAQKDCATLVTLLGSYSAVLCGLDLLAGVALLSASDAVLASISLARESPSDSAPVVTQFRHILLVNVAWVVCEGALACLALMSLQKMSIAESWLRETGLDSVSVLGCARSMGLISSRRIFNQRGDTLGAAHDSHLAVSSGGRNSITTLAHAPTVGSGEYNVEAGVDDSNSKEASRLAASAALARQANGTLRDMSGRGSGKKTNASARKESKSTFAQTPCDGHSLSL